jgi:alpha-tubulin suppressor-like RCC1 family protein
LAAGNGFTCVVSSVGAVSCWGANSKGQLGDGTTANRFFPIVVVLLSDAVAVGAGDEHSCVLRADQSVSCWGSNWAGQLGDATTTDRAIPAPVLGLTGVVSIGVGVRHSCALDTAGAVWCWGANESGQIGDGTVISSRNARTKVTGLPGPAVAIGAGLAHTCALLADNRVFCWGANGYMELGDATNASSTSPVAVQF